MANQYNTLKQLRARKEQLKKEISEMERLITFDNPKESLSAITGGFTDKFLSETKNEQGETSLALNTGNIIHGIGNTLSNRRKTLINFDHTNLQDSLIQNTLKLGGAALMGSIAKKNMKSGKWKNKLLGLALVYFLPVALRIVRNKLEHYQKSQSLKSFEKLI